MCREEIVVIVKDDLKALREVEHVADLMKAGRIEELEIIANKIDFFEVQHFLNEDYLGLTDKEIKDFYIELTFYICISGFSEFDFIKNVDLFRHNLKNTGILGNLISEKLQYQDLEELVLSEIVKQ